MPAETDLVILPGSKATIADLVALRVEGWDIDIQAHVRRGGHVLGICGGYQMLGKRVADPQAIEGPAGSIAGLGLLDVETVLTAEKTLRSVSGTLRGGNASFAGYEMHVGDTSGPDCARPAVTFAEGRPDGAIAANGRISGHYVHGIFGETSARAALLATLGVLSSGEDHDAKIEATLDALAVHIAEHVDLDRLFALAR